MSLRLGGAPVTLRLGSSEVGRAYLGASLVLGSPPDSGPSGFFADNFATQDATKWNYIGAASATGGQLSLPASGYGTTSSSVMSADTFDLTGGSFTFKISAVTDATGSVAFLTMALLDGAGTAGYRFFIYQTDDAIAAAVQQDYRTTGNAWNQQFTGARQSWLRIRHAAPNVLWETSTDAVTWTVLRTVATSSLPPLTGLRISIDAQGSGVGAYLLDDVEFKTAVV